MNRTLVRLCFAMALLVGALTSSGCLIVSEEESYGGGCYDDCYDYEVCESYCDAWSCWDECWYETSCTTVCDEYTYEEEEVVTVDCYSDLDCGDGQICVADVCVARDTEERGFSGLCQVCETTNDCYEDDALCVRLNYDQVSRTGEKVCTRTCEYDTDCPANFECVKVSDEVGDPAQCLPVTDGAGERTCNPSPELECVRATDCRAGESCKNNECTAPDTAECSADSECASGQVCKNFSCKDADGPECTTRQDCSSGEVCIDGSCVQGTTSCVFNNECDGGVCVNGQCQNTCSADSECAFNEHCREGLCEVIDCRRSADCGTGEVCVDAQCEATCTSDANCDAGYVCNDFNYCEPDPAVDCRTNAECGMDEICVEGACQTPCSCNQQCDSGDVCNLNTGTCESPDSTPAPSCQDDCDCPSGQTCNSGTCG